MDTEKTIQDKVRAIVNKHKGDKSALVTILQDVQDEYCYLPKEALIAIHEQMDIPMSRVYEVATFYDAFSLTPRGQFIIEVCTGTTCHVQGGINLLDTFERSLRINCGETTDDGLFSIGVVGCLGCCSIAPVVRVNDTIHPQMTQEEIPRVVRTYMAKRYGR